MLESTRPLNQLHGKFFEYNGIPMIITYHPSALLRDESLKASAWQGLELFKNKLIQISGTFPLIRDLHIHIPLHKMKKSKQFL